MEKITVFIAGMHCRSCEILIEDELAKIPEVRKCSVDHRKGIAEISYSGQKPNEEEIENAVREAGYAVGEIGARPWLTRHASEYRDLGVAFLFLVGVWIVLRNLGVAEWRIPGAENPSSLGVVFVVGLTAGLSTCLALVGGLVLGVTARHAERHPEATALQKFRPHLFFNAGRIASYVVLGGLLGWIGSVLSISGLALGILTIGVGLVMLVLGLKLTGIFPRLENFSLTLPKAVTRALRLNRHHEREYSHGNAALLGALTFFLPCGFTQAMQLYAVSTGSFTQGAFIMGTFALGTAPGLLGIGGVASAVKGIFARRFFKFAGIVVVLLAFFNISNGLNLTGWKTGVTAGLASKNTKTQSPVQATGDPNVEMIGGVQIVRMTENARGYTPNTFTIQKGVPVRWVIDAQAPYSCASSLVVSSLGIRKNLKQGENVIEFTPEKVGEIPFSCSMGMYTGAFTVVEGNGSGQTNADKKTSEQKGFEVAPQTGGTCGGSGGCGAAAKPVTPTEGETETASGVSNVGAVQLIKTTYALDTDIAPNTFTVKAGKPVRFEIEARDSGYGCMSTIMIPGLYELPQSLRAGQTIVMEFSSDTKGEYPITCAMGVPRGKIVIN